MATFGEKLKAIRLSRDMSQDDIARVLNTTKQSISRYETGQNSPRIDTVDFIADRLGIELSLLINDDYSINDVLNYRKRVVPQRSKYITHTVDIMSKINDDGKKEISNYADYIYSNKSYRTPLIAEDYTELYTIGSAAAGRGFAYGDDIEDYKLFMTTDIPDHDFAVNVDGDSMFPTIGDGETAFIVKDYDKIDNDIYLLDIDGETVIKRVVFGDDEITLISDNEAYDDRVVKEFELKQTRILGRVVGWAMPG